MTVALAPKLTTPDRKAWALVVGLAALWVLLYRTILPFWNWVVYNLAGLNASTQLGSGVHFFLYDTSKILLLLSGMIFVISTAQTFITVERTRAMLTGRRAGLGNALAAILGVITPFCSCSSIPVFMGFVAAGVPLGITLTFLISSPLISEVAAIMLLGLFGWKIAGLYVLSGLIISMLGGWLLGSLHLEKYLDETVTSTKLGKLRLKEKAPTWTERFQAAGEEVKAIILKVWPYLLIGIGVGAFIHGWVPANFFERYAGPHNPFAVIVAVLVGVPLYANAAGLLPLIGALHEKGLAMGTLLAFMMATIALSVPELILLRRVMKPRLLAIYVAVVTVGIIFTGYLFNAVL